MRGLAPPETDLQSAPLWTENQRLREEIARLESELRGSQHAHRQIQDQLTSAIAETLAHTRSLQRAKDAIENERENFYNLFRQTPEMVCVLSGPEHLFIFVNEAHVRVLGFNATGMKVREAQPDSIEIHGILDDVYLQGETAKLREIPVTVSGRLRYFNLTYSASRDMNGKIQGIVILGSEVSDVVEAREVLLTNESREKGARETLQKALEARDTFLGIASHELKTPLTSLKLQSQMNLRLLEKNGPSAFSVERLKKLIEQPIIQVDRLSRLVDDMLDVSRINLGKLSMNFEAINFSLLVRDTLSRFAPQLEAAGCSLNLKIDDTLLIQGDAFRLEQVLTNLITNAAKYAAGTPVEISLTKIANQAVLKVCDQGRGIPREKLDRVFERFERLVSANEVSGLGLGLHISKEIVLAHGGTIQVESELGQGAQFSVKVPLDTSRPKS